MTESEFIEEISKLNIDYDEKKIEMLNKYYEILISYNKVMNLTGITEKNQVYLKHFYDSLTLLKVVNLNEYNSLCDIGTGAGFPGIVLKIFYPHLKITLVDSLNKRIQFLNEVVKLLNLDSVELIHSRIEDYAHDNKEKFDIVTSRAVAPLNILLEYAMPIVKTNLYFVALKGKEEEKNSYTSALRVLNSSIKDINKFKLPKENSDRTIYLIKKNGKIKDKYPRKLWEIKKNML